METAVLEHPILKEVPDRINDSEIFSFLYTKNIDWRYVDAMIATTDFSDHVLSNWLNISIKTFEEYKKPETTFGQNVQEQILLLLSLMKHGINVFGTAKNFDEWLGRKNFFFDFKPPMEFLHTITGIHFIDDRLTAMEYGDNV